MVVVVVVVDTDTDDVLALVDGLRKYLLQCYGVAVAKIYERSQWREIMGCFLDTSYTYLLR